jgi:hypothetical protein
MLWAPVIRGGAVHTPGHHGRFPLVRDSHDVYVQPSTLTLGITMPDADPTRQANRLYWETDAPVADIAEELDISRRMLYDLITPRPAHSPCPACGAPLGYRNRTALDRRQAECPECEVEVTLEPGPGSPPGPAGDSDDDARGMEAPRTTPSSASGPLLGGALLLGIATGAAAAFLVRRR